MPRGRPKKETNQTNQTKEFAQVVNTALEEKPNKRWPELSEKEKINRRQVIALIANNNKLVRESGKKLKQDLDSDTKTLESLKLRLEKGISQINKAKELNRQDLVGQFEDGWIELLREYQLTNEKVRQLLAIGVDYLNE